MIKPQKKRENVKLQNHNKTPNDKSKKEMLIIIALTLLFMLIYFTAASLPSELRYVSFAVMIIYMVALAAFAIVYICYNYAFTRKDVTVDMLPDTWSEEKKQEFINKAVEHKARSRWMLMIIFPLIVTFIADVLYLFVWTGFLEKFFL